MELLVNFLLLIGTVSAATFSWVLSRRVRRLSDLDQGLGAAIGALSSQVDDMNKALDLAQKHASSSTQEIEALTARAEKAASRLELLLAGLHENPQTPQNPEHDEARQRKRRIAELKAQKRMAAQERAELRKKAVGSPVKPEPPNHPTRQEMIDSITKTIGSLNR